MPIIKRKKKVKIVEVRRFKGHLTILLKDEGQITMGVNLPVGATQEEIDQAIKQALYVEVGERVPELEGREVVVEYEEEVEKE